MRRLPKAIRSIEFGVHPLEIGVLTRPRLTVGLRLWQSGVRLLCRLAILLKFRLPLLWRWRLFLLLQALLPVLL